MSSLMSQAINQARATYNKPIVKNPLLATTAGLIASKGLQVANNSYHLVKNSSMIVNPSQIAGPLLLAALAGHTTKLLLNQILPDSYAANYIKNVTYNAVHVGTLMALAGPAGASVALIEVLAFSFLSGQVSSLMNALSYQTGIQALRPSSYN